MKRCNGADAWATNRDAILALIRSVRTPTAQEASLQPLRIVVERTKAAGKLPAASVFATHAQEHTEILNQLYPDGAVQTGQWIKSVK